MFQLGDKQTQNETNILSSILLILYFILSQHFLLSLIFYFVFHWFEPVFQVDSKLNVVIVVDQISYNGIPVNKRWIQSDPKLLCISLTIRISLHFYDAFYAINCSLTFWLSTIACNRCFQFTSNHKKTTRFYNSPFFLPNTQVSSSSVILCGCSVFYHTLVLSHDLVLWSFDLPLASTGSRDFLVLL